MIFDNVKHYANILIANLKGNCIRCETGKLERITRERNTKYIDYECNTCHLRVGVTTRNNSRVTETIICGLAICGIFFIIGSILG